MSAWSVPVIDPFFTILMLLSLIEAEDDLLPSALSISTLMPVMVAFEGIEKPNPVATR